MSSDWRKDAGLNGEDEMDDKSLYPESKLRGYYSDVLGEEAAVILGVSLFTKTSKCKGSCFA